MGKIILFNIKCQVCGQILKVPESASNPSYCYSMNDGTLHFKILYFRAISKKPTECYYTKDYALIIDDGLSKILKYKDGSYRKPIIIISKILSYREFIDGISSGRWSKLSCLI